MSVPYQQSIKTFAICVLLFMGVSIDPALCRAAGMDEQIFNIVDYGAKHDGSAPATDAFKAAIL